MRQLSLCCLQLCSPHPAAMAPTQKHREGAQLITDLNSLRESCCPSLWGPLPRRMLASVPDSLGLLQTCSGWAWGQDTLGMPDFCRGSGLRTPLGVPLRGSCWQVQPCQHLVLSSFPNSFLQAFPNALRCLVCTSCRNPNPCSKG